MAYLPEVFAPDDISEDSARYYVWDYFGSNQDKAASSIGFEEFGVDYNVAAIESNSICPSGWHVSGFYEWISMLHSLAYEYTGSTPNFYTPKDLLDDNYDWDLNLQNHNEYGEILNGTRFSVKPARVVYLGSSTPFFDGFIEAQFGCIKPMGRMVMKSQQIYCYDYGFANKAFAVRCVKD